MSNKSPTKSVASVTLVVAFALSASGCTTVAPAEIEPLEDRAEVLFGQVEFELQLTDDLDHFPRYEAAFLYRQLVVAAEILVDYSVSLIDTARNYSDEEAVTAVLPLVRGLHSDLSELSIISAHLNQVDVEATLANAAEQKDLTRALRASAPIISEVANALRDSINSRNGGLNAPSI